jgi:hypothetical protein
MRLLILVLFSLLLACRNSPHSQATTTQTKDLPARGDSAGGDAGASGATGETAGGLKDRSSRFDTANYRLHTRMMLNEYAISLWQCAGAFNSVCPPVLVIRNIRTKKGDTLVITHISDLQERAADIEDITKTAGFRQLTLMLSWEGEDDNIFSEVVGFQEDTLKELFAIPNAGGMSDTLRRKDKWTLVGHVFDRDDIVSRSHDNYLIRVSLKDFSVHISPPDTVVISYDTKARDTIHAYRISPSGKKAPYTILPETQLHIDSFFYKQKIVRLHLRDSIRLSVPQDEIQFKVYGESAG